MVTRGRKITEDKPRRSKGSGLPRSVADSLARITKTICSKQGFTQSEIITRWKDIVGPVLAVHVVPDRLVFSKGGKGGTLHVLADTAFALELQHLEPQVLERINGYFGYPAIARIAIKQSPIYLKTYKKRNILRPQAADKADAEALVPAMENQSLQAALTSLGSYVMADTRQESRQKPGRTGGARGSLGPRP